VRVALTIAGSDSSAGAGIQADLKTFAAHGVFGVSAITAVTAQNTTGVIASAPMPADLVTSQLEAVVSDIGVHAAKTGMLAHAAVVHGRAERHRPAALEGRQQVNDRAAAGSSRPRSLG